MKVRLARRRFGLAGALGLAVTIVVLSAAPAAAHAVLVTTTPTSGGTIPTSPEQIQLVFSESVEVSLGSIELFNDKGDRVDIGAPHHSTTDRAIEADVPKLDNGGYVVTWRVISADSHPVHGAFTFAVGRSSGDAQALATKLEAQQDANRTVGVVFAITRAAEFAGIALLIGATVFAAAIRPNGRRRSRADRLVWIGWVVLLVSTVFAVMLQGPYASALPLSSTWDSDVIRDVLRTRYGHYAEVRIVFMLLALPLLLMVRKTWRPPAWWWAPITVLGLGIAATPGLAGHASNGIWSWLAMPFDTLHVTSMAIWLGGLASLAIVVLDRDPDARRAAERFSPVALTSVVVIVITGVFATWRQVGFTRDAFLDTSFGRILLAKIAVFVALIALAAWSRRIVRARRPMALSAAVATESKEPGPEPAPADPDVRNLRWSVIGELVFGITVLVLTSMLVNAQPARSALALPFSTEMRTPNMLIDVTVDPAEAGPVVMHVYTLTPSGASQYIVNATATMSLPSKGIAPIEVPLERAGPSHFQNTNFTVPFAGKWQLVVRAYKTPVDEAAGETTVPIRSSGATMIRRVIVAGAIAIAATGVLAAPAAAHVTIDPPSVPKGSTAQLSFVVPNESDTARTTRVQVFFPAPPEAIPEVSVEALTGWHFAIRKQRLSSPIVTDDGSISEVVSSITWVANNASTAIGPDEFAAFSINADGIPDDADELVFRVVQTYSDGKSVAWVDPVSDSGPEAEHPTPILALTDGTGSEGEPTATTTTEPAPDDSGADASAAPAGTQDDNARALAVIGIIVGGVALVAATGALMRRRRGR